MTLYMKVGKAPYYLPEIVADSGPELARLYGIKINSLYSMLSRGVGGFMKIEVPEEDDD